MAWPLVCVRLARGLRYLTVLACGLFAVSHASAGTVASLYLNVGDDLVGYGGDWSEMGSAPGSLRKYVALTVVPRVDSASGVDLLSLLSGNPVIGLTTTAMPGDPGSTTVYLGKPQKNSNRDSDNNRHSNRQSSSHNQQNNRHSSQRQGHSSQRAAEKFLRWLQKHPGTSLDAIVVTNAGYYHSLLSQVSVEDVATFEIDDTITGLLTTNLPACEPLPELLITEALPPVITDPQAEPSPQSDPTPDGSTQPPVHMPEPASLTILATGCLALAISKRRRTA